MKDGTYLCIVVRNFQQNLSFRDNGYTLSFDVRLDFDGEVKTLKIIENNYDL